MHTYKHIHTQYNTRVLDVICVTCIDICFIVYQQEKENEKEREKDVKEYMSIQSTCMIYTTDTPFTVLHTHTKHRPHALTHT